jgi:acyl-CoA thioesterase-1
MKPFADWVGTLRAYGAALALRNLAAAALLLLAVPASADVRILAFGDSLTQGYGLPEAAGFVPRLQAWLAANGAGDVTVVNGGVSGDTSAGGLARIGWSLGDDIDGVIVELGANDMLRGQSPNAVEGNLAAILERTRDAHPGVRFVVAGMRAAPNLGRDYAQAFDAVYPRIVDRFDAAYVPFLLEDVAARPELNQIDGIHPTAQGHALIAQRVWQTLEPVLQAAQASDPTD